jgi:hypothetical protein
MGEASTEYLSQPLVGQSIQSTSKTYSEYKQNVFRILLDLSTIRTVIWQQPQATTPFTSEQMSIVGSLILEELVQFTS